MLLQGLLFAGDPFLVGAGALFFYSLMKIFFVVGGIFYLIFAFVVLRQIHLMQSTVITPLSGFMKILGLLHLLLALGVLFFYITTL